MKLSLLLQYIGLLPALSLIIIGLYQIVAYLLSPYHIISSFIYILIGTWMVLYQSDEAKKLLINYLPDNVKTMLFEKSLTDLMLDPTIVGKVLTILLLCNVLPIEDTKLLIDALPPEGQFVRKKGLINILPFPIQKLFLTGHHDWLLRRSNQTIDEDNKLPLINPKSSAESNLMNEDFFVLQTSLPRVVPQFDPSFTKFDFLLKSKSIEFIKRVVNTSYQRVRISLINQIAFLLSGGHLKSSQLITIAAFNSILLITSYHTHIVHKLLSKWPQANKFISKLITSNHTIHSTLRRMAAGLVITTTSCLTVRCLIRTRPPTLPAPQPSSNASRLDLLPSDSDSLTRLHTALSRQSVRCMDEMNGTIIVQILEMMRRSEVFYHQVHHRIHRWQNSFHRRIQQLFPFYKYPNMTMDMMKGLVLICLIGWINLILSRRFRTYKWLSHILSMRLMSGTNNNSWMNFIDFWVTFKDNSHGY